MTLRPAYALAALVLFIVEVLIALFATDGFIRPYVGDMLAVVLVYAALRAVTPLGVRTAILVALAIAFAVEFAQLFNLLDALGWRDNRLAVTLLGGAFDPADLAAYTAAAAIILAVETLRRR